MIHLSAPHVIHDENCAKLNYGLYIKALHGKLITSTYKLIPKQRRTLTYFLFPNINWIVHYTLAFVL